MRGVKPRQMDDSVCLLIARVSTGQVSHLGVRGCGGYCMVEHTSELYAWLQRSFFFVTQVHFTNKNSSAKAGKYSNRLTFKRHLKQMNQEKRVCVHFNCLFYYSILPGTVPLVLSLTWKKYSYCLMASALFLYVICFFYTSQKKMVSYGCRMQERGVTHSQIVSSTSVWLLLAVSSDFIFEISQTGCTLLPVAYLSLLWVNGLNIPKRSLTQTNRPSPPLPFPYSLLLLARPEKTPKTVLFRGWVGRRVKESSASRDKNNSRHSGHSPRLHEESKQISSLYVQLFHC